MSPEASLLTLERLISGLLDGVRDLRVAEAVRKEFLPSLDAHVRQGFFTAFTAHLGEDAGDFRGFPETVDSDVDAALAFLSTEAVPYLKHGAAAVAELSSSWLQAHRPDIVASLQASGELKEADREPILAQAALLLDQAEGLRVGLVNLPADSDHDAVQRAMLPAVEAFEQARELLFDLDLDDALLGRLPPSPPDAQAETATRAMAPDVEALLLRAWCSEADLHTAAAERVGPALSAGEVGTFEQAEFLLDAIVALQEALQIRFDVATALRLANLRHAKGDVGEARALCEQVLGMEGETARHPEAEDLLERISKSSPLGKDSRCFIATAAMGDSEAHEVRVLRRFRDRHLMSGSTGRLLVAAYYRLSPPAARFIARHAGLRRVIRDLAIRPLAFLVDDSAGQS